MNSRLIVSAHCIFTTRIISGTKIKQHNNACILLTASFYFLCWLLIMALFGQLVLVLFCFLELVVCYLKYRWEHCCTQTLFKLKECISKQTHILLPRCIISWNFVWYVLIELRSSVLAARFVQLIDRGTGRQFFFFTSVGVCSI